VDAGVVDGGVSTGDPCRPFVMPSAATLFGSSKKVFAHYFQPFPLSLDNKDAGVDYYSTQYLTPGGESGKWLTSGGYLRSRPLPVARGTPATYQLDNMKKEIALAIAGGITGFTYDVLGASEANAGSRLQTLLTAATQVDSRFKIVVMADMTALGANQASVQNVIASVANSPAAYHLPDGRLVVSAFAASVAPASFWQTIFTNLANQGITVAFVPVFLGWQSQVSNFSAVSYGLSDWGTASPTAATGMLGWPATAHAAGKIFMTPTDPMQYRPKNNVFWEGQNSLAFRDSWKSAIDGGADWVQVVTWSDYSESSQIEPYTDATLRPDIGTGFYDLNAYYAAWFLTGQAPTITDDALFFFYRREPTSASATAQNAVTPVLAGAGPATNLIEVVSLLTAPGTVSITIGGQTQSTQAGAGLTSFTVPLQAGVPHFALARNGSQVFGFDGPITIVGNAGLPSQTLDLTYWNGSATARGVCAIHLP
jgi:hypothetical protein